MKFADLPSTEAKWLYIQETMDYILSMDAKYNDFGKAFSVRRRLNPHHPESDVALETARFKEEQRKIRVDQHQRWANLKNLYAEHRDELANTCGNPSFEECKSILERIFAEEVDSALRSIVGEEQE